MNLEEKLFEFFNATFSQVGMPLVFAYENGLRPQKDYVTLYAKGSEFLPVHTGAVDDNGRRKLAWHQTFELQLQLYGKNCMVLADAVAALLDTDECILRADALGLAWHSNPKIDNVPALLDNLSYEPRALWRITGQHTLEMDENVGFIATVNGTSTITGGIQPLTTDFSAFVVEIN